MGKVVSYLHLYRFQFFFGTQLLILFGSLFVPYEIHEDLVSPLVFIVNLTAGYFIVLNHSIFSKLLRVLIALLIIEYLASSFVDVEQKFGLYLRFFGYFIFYAIVSFHLIRQVWRAVEINASVIFGLMSGYIALGLIGFFIFNTIDIFYSDAFAGINTESGSHYQTKGNQLLYFSFITLMTIGYGEIVPLIPIAQKAAILVGLIGQLYLVIITSIVVGKYINQYNR